MTKHSIFFSSTSLDK